MDSPDDKPGIKLDYRWPVDEATGPTGFRIIAGIFCFILGFVPFVMGLNLLWLAAAALFQFKPYSRHDALFERSSAIGLAFGAAMCWYAANVMFRMARRMFRAKLKDRSFRFNQ